MAKKAERKKPEHNEGEKLTAEGLFAILSEVRPAETVTVQESPSNFTLLFKWWPIEKPRSFYTCASGGLGWNTPAAVGLALAERKQQKRPVIAFIGDGSLQYSIQALYTAVQHKLKIVYVVPCNQEYAVLKAFAELEKTPGVPGLDLPGLNISALAQGYGCRAVEAKDADSVKAAFNEALKFDGTTVLSVPIQQGFRPIA